MQQPIRVFIVEDHVIFLEGLKRILDDIDGIRVSGIASTGQAFLDQLNSMETDVVLMDIRMPGLDGIETTERALRTRPDLKIIVFSIFGAADYLHSMILLGINGFVLKSTSLANLEKAIRTVADGGQFFSPELNVVLAKRLRQVSSADIATFTKKENEILQYLCRGLSTREISDLLSVSKRTVEGYRAKMIQKTGVSNTTNLVIYAFRNNLVRIESSGAENISGDKKNNI